MTLRSKTKIVAILSDASLLMTLFAGLPYTLGDIANSFPPTVKKWVVIISLSGAAGMKIIQRTLELVNSPSDQTTVITSGTTPQSISVTSAPAGQFPPVPPDQKIPSSTPVQGPKLP